MKEKRKYNHHSIIIVNEFSQQQEQYHIDLSLIHYTKLFVMVYQKCPTVVSKNIVEILSRFEL